MPRLGVVTAPASTALERSVGDYLAHVKARGLSPRTVSHYEAVLTRVLLPFLADQGVSEPGQLNQRLLDRLTAHLLDEGGQRGPLSRHSVHSYSRAISHYLSWARKEGELETQAKPQLPKLPRKLLDTLSREEIRAMEDAASTERDKLIVRILADTGLRLSEFLGLTGGDLIDQGKDRYVRVRGKGAKERLVPLTPNLMMRLRRYVQRGRPQDAASDRIFLTLRRSRLTGDYEPLDARAVQELMSVTAARLGITKPTNPHAFRHAFATNALRRGMNPLQLKDILGHETLDMISNVYSHLTPSDAAAALMAVLQEER